jgi:hypothetical protein
VAAVGRERRGRARGERVRPRLRLGERVGGNEIAVRQPRQVTLFLLSVPK